MAMTTRLAWTGLQLAVLISSVGCVLVHLALLLPAPSPLGVAMLALAAGCLLCLRPRRTAPVDAAWGGAMAMSAGMMLLHVASSGSGIGGHLHRLPAGAATGLDALHGAALALSTTELALLMAATVAIGIGRRRRLVRSFADSGTGFVNLIDRFPSVNQH